RGLRGGTESIVQIGAMAKALEMASVEMTAEKQHILNLKQHFWKGLKALFPQAYVNGLGLVEEESLYTVLNVSLPELATDSMLLFNLDLKGLAVSGGSACSSGSLQQSHVISSLNPNHSDPVIRFSFSALSTETEIKRALEILAELSV
ncbi:MAG: aminotransferase class V-fold PLP-dependent enzyme, partial [Croceimicrobium sp.]